VLSGPVIGDAADVAYWRARAEQAEGQVAKLDARVAELSEQVAVLSRMLFGRSSEKTNPVPDQGGQAGEPDRPDTRGARGRDEPERKRGQRPGSKGHGRRDYSHLDTREEIHDVPADARVCACCGLEFEFLGSLDQ
jgi:transposase